VVERIMYWQTPLALLLLQASPLLAELCSKDRIDDLSPPMTGRQPILLQAKSGAAFRHYVRISFNHADAN
jgi:hypothetical protein